MNYYPLLTLSVHLPRLSRPLLPRRPQPWLRPQPPRRRLLSLLQPPPLSRRPPPPRKTRHVIPLGAVCLPQPAPPVPRPRQRRAAVLRHAKLARMCLRWTDMLCERLGSRAQRPRTFQTVFLLTSSVSQAQSSASCCPHRFYLFQHTHSAFLVM